MVFNTSKHTPLKYSINISVKTVLKVSFSGVTSSEKFSFDKYPAIIFIKETEMLAICTDLGKLKMKYD